MGMADGDTEGVGGMVGRRHLGERQQHLHHLLHLQLAGPAVADHGLLDAERRVIGRIDAALGAGEHDNAARLPHGQRRPQIDAAEELLDGGGARLVFINDAQHALVYLPQPLVSRFPGRGGNGAVRHQPRLVDAMFDDAPAGDRRAGVKPKNQLC